MASDDKSARLQQLQIQAMRTKLLEERMARREEQLHLKADLRQEMDRKLLEEKMARREEKIKAELKEAMNKLKTEVRAETKAAREKAAVLQQMRDIKRELAQVKGQQVLQPLAAY